MCENGPIAVLIRNLTSSRPYSFRKRKFGRGDAAVLEILSNGSSGTEKTLTPTPFLSDVVVNFELGGWKPTSSSKSVQMNWERGVDKPAGGVEPP